VPFMVWAVDRERPSRRIMFCAFVMLLGIALLTIEDDLSVNMGDVLTFLCAVLYAVEILMVDRWGQGVDVFSFTCVQMYASGISALLVALVAEDFPSVWNLGMAANLLYCGLASTLFAFVLMNVGIRYADPDYAALYMSTESAFGVFFGVIFLKESMSPRMWVGCVLVLLAITVSQIRSKKERMSHGV